MTEAEFELKKASLRRSRQEAAQREAEARALVNLLDERIIKLIGSAQQEPWFGEAND